MTERKFFKTKVVVTVLSEDVPPEFDTLKELAHMISEGDDVGVYEVTQTKVLNGKQAARALKRLGSQPSFFQLNDKGDDDE